MKRTVEALVDLPRISVKKKNRGKIVSKSTENIFLIDFGKGKQHVYLYKNEQFKICKGI
jgi:hypothetical protein